MSDALAKNLPMQVLMGVLLKNLLGWSSGSGEAPQQATQKHDDDDPDQVEAILRQYSR